MDRRTFLKTGAAASLGSAMPIANRVHAAPGRTQTQPQPRKPYQGGKSPWPISLDGATVGWPDLATHIDVAAKAGYDAIEPWMRQLEKHEQAGGSLKDAGKQLRDRGLFVPSIIGLWDAIPTKRSGMDKAIKANRPRLRMASDLGAEHVQTIPAREGEMDLAWAGEAYRRILDIGLNDYELVPALVFVEMFTIKTLGAAAHAALMADHPKARMIPDTFHMHLTGSNMSGLGHLSGDFIAIFQFNDAPAQPKRAKLEDSDRVMPGDGILPLTNALQNLQRIGFDRAVSLELYNPKYQEMAPLDAARLGLRKTVDVIEQAV